MSKNKMLNFIANNEEQIKSFGKMLSTFSSGQEVPKVEQISIMKELLETMFTKVRVNQSLTKKSAYLIHSSIPTKFTEDSNEFWGME